MPAAAANPRLFVAARVLIAASFSTALLVTCPHTSLPTFSRAIQVDLLVFYTREAMGQVAAATAVQMETIIAAAFASTNEAMANSAISLDINVVHVQPVSVAGALRQCWLPHVVRNSESTTLYGSSPTVQQ